MKIVEMPPYYWPEQISSTHLTADLTEEFINRGYLIENYVPVPCRGISEETRKKYSKILYEEKYDGKLKIFRFRMWKEGRNPVMRAFRYFISNVIQAKKGLKAKNVDIIIGGSTPPVQGLLCGLVAKKLSKKNNKKVPFLYLLQDVFPDSLVTTGLAKKDGFLWKIGRIVENKVYNNADKIIVISESIKQNIMNKGVSADKIAVISNWINCDEVKPISKENNSLYIEYSINPELFTVCYAGNLGAAQGTNIIFEVAELLADVPNIHFVIFGRGRDYNTLKEKISENNSQNITLFPTLGQDRISEVYSLGDLNLITCKKGVGKTALPSKLWTIMACNSRIVASYDLDSDLSKIIMDNDYGVCVEPENSKALAKAIYNEYNMGKVVTNSRNYVLKYASKEVCVEKYIQEIDKLVGEECK